MPLAGVCVTIIDRFATDDRVTDDTMARFKLAGDGFRNAPCSIGTKVEFARGPADADLRALHLGAGMTCAAEVRS
jgi:hypothetical protein